MNTEWMLRATNTEGNGYMDMDVKTAMGWRKIENALGI